MKQATRKSIYWSSVILGTALASYFTGCSKVSFNPAPASCGDNCVMVSNQNNTHYSYSVGSRRADILFVVDNSASMYSIQQSMGNKFNALFSAIQNMDYQIAITTTDVTSGSASLLSFPDGSKVLNKNSQDVQNAFLNTIARPETLACQNYIAAGSITSSGYKKVCASDDTRAIFAANSVVSSNPSSIVRDASVPLNVIILSNSDERAAGGTDSRPLETNDLPQTLISNVQNQFPGKQLQVHSVVVKPGDTSCYNAQKISASEFGFYGTNYVNLSSSTGGTSQSICDSDYSSVLSGIAQSLLTDRGDRDLACNPKDISVILSPNQSIGYSVVNTASGGWRLQFNDALPAGTQVEVDVTCQ